MPNSVNPLDVVVFPSARPRDGRESTPAAWGDRGDRRR